jgi:hypothetical protein
MSLKETRFVFPYENHSTDIVLEIENEGITFGYGKKEVKEINIEDLDIYAITTYDIKLEKYLFFRLMKTYKEGNEIKNIILLEDKYGKETNDEDRNHTETELNIQHEITVSDDEGNEYSIPVIMYNENNKEEDEIKLNERTESEYKYTEEEPTFDTVLGSFSLEKQS